MAEVIKYYNTSLGVLKDMVKEKDVNAVLDYMEQKGKTPALSAIVPPAAFSISAVLKQELYSYPRLSKKLTKKHLQVLQLTIDFFS